MADIGNPNIVISQDIIYRVYAASKWINIAYRGNVEAGLRNRRTLRLPDFTPNAQVDNPADADALLTKPTLSKRASMSSQDITTAFVRAVGAIPQELINVSGGGAQAQMQLNEDISIKMAQNVDGKITDAVAGLTFDKDYDGGSAMQITIGKAGTTFLPGGRLASPTGDVGKAVAGGMLDALQLLHELDVLGGVDMGTNAPTAAVAAMCPYPVARQLVEYAIATGNLQTRSDIAGQAAIEGGIASLDAFQGRWSGIDIIAYNYQGGTATNVSPKSDNSTPWKTYVVPTMSTLAAGFDVNSADISDQSFSAGTTDGVYETRRTALGRYATKVLRPGHVCRIDLPAK